MHSSSAALRWSRRIAVVVLLGACMDDDEVVYPEPPFENPPEEAAGFLGYDEAAEKLTVCGNCHVGQQSQWQTSPHSSAFATLQNSGSMQGTCQKCHTVNNLGNAVTDTAVGYRSTKDSRYHDVQCESCHGPGLVHVTNPDASQPQASIVADTLATTGCGECHSGAHHPFVSEWQRSAHGRLVNNSTATTSANCIGCHTAQGTLARWGETANYIERNGPALPQVCAVCHDPHGSPNSGQLRHPSDTPDEQRNLCMQCHNRRGTPDPASSSSGPHAPEGPILLGYAGWWPPSMSFTPGDSTFLATHGSDRNPRLCATCHVERFTVRDTLTQDFMMEVVGHLFLAAPCVNSAGIPTGQTNCPRAERRYESCAASGCHSSATSARNLHTLAESRIDPLIAALDALLARIPASEFSSTDGRYTTAEGSKFNSQLAKTTGAEVHNPFLIEALLRASIEQIRKDYNLTPTAPLPPPMPTMKRMLEDARLRARYREYRTAALTTR